jgi:phospholipid/cholesterol/gamma-HCH transport system permease protein|tara:strand:+ start:42793 stop:43455 length:663 start_codon:yes stop_codon:yes gene_type:complete
MKKLILKDIDDLIIGSLGIVAFISFFVGGVVTIQTALNIDNPLIPKNLVGFATRQSIILEFAPTFMSIIMAGKVGSFITSSIGTMRVTEQIDALEVMGINSLNYLVFPKFIALTLYPFVISISMFLGIMGGLAACVYGGYATMPDYIEGIQLDFKPFHMAYAFIKTLLFAFILATVPSYHGYYMKGGALEVGKASTTSFVWTSVMIILLNYILTQLLLSQ